LRKSDLERVGPADVIERRDAYGLGAYSLPALRPDDDERTDDERARDGNRREEMGLDRLVERETDDRRRKERDDQVERETSRGHVTAEPREHRDELCPEFPAHRENRARLNDDLERFRLLAGVAHERAGHDQVAGR